MTLPAIVTNSTATLGTCQMLAQGLQDPTESTWRWLFYVGSAAVALGGISLTCWAARRWQQRREKRIRVQQWKLFRELCQIHQLNPTETTQLRRLTRILKLQNPAMLFVKPDCFEVPRPSQFFSQDAWRELLELRDRLFARRIERPTK